MVNDKDAIVLVLGEKEFLVIVTTGNEFKNEVVSPKKKCSQSKNS